MRERVVARPAEAASARPARPEEVLPWHAGAIEWSERYGSLLAEARRWRTAAFLALLVAGIAVAGAISFARAPKVVPYIVQVDKHGFTVPVAAAEATTVSDQRNVISAAGNWLLALRSVRPSAEAQYELVQQAYRYMPPNSNAWNKANRAFEQANPLERSGERVVEVDLSRVASMRSIHELTVEWIERARSQTGTTVESKFSAYLTIAISPPTTQQEVVMNPAGVFITDFTITQTF